MSQITNDDAKIFLAQLRKYINALDIYRTKSIADLEKSLEAYNDSK